MLSEQNRKKLDNIVKEMNNNGETDENIQWVVNDFKNKYSENSEQEQKNNPINNMDNTTYHNNLTNEYSNNVIGIKQEKNLNHFTRSDLEALISGAGVFILIIFFMLIKKINKKNFDRFKETKYFKFIKKEKIKFIISLVIIFISLYFYNIYSNNNKIKKFCTLQIDYRVSHFKYKDKKFKTKADAMEYCILTSNKH